MYISTPVFSLACPGLYSSIHMIWKSWCLDFCFFSRLFPVTFERASTLGNILTFTFVVWIVNRFEQIPLQNSRKALKANEHSLGDINRVNIATSDGFLLFTRLLKALPYNSMTSNENAHTHRTKVQQSHSIENAHICGGRPQSWASGEISKLKNTRTASGPPPKFSLHKLGLTPKVNNTYIFWTQIWNNVSSNPKGKYRSKTSFIKTV